MTKSTVSIADRADADRQYPSEPQSALKRDPGPITTGAPTCDKQH